MILSNEKIELISGCIAVSGSSHEHADIKSSKFCCEILECNFEGSYFYQTNLSGIHFEHSDMSGDFFEDVNLSGASFQSSDISGSEFGEANLEGSTITDSDLSGVEITNCKLDGMTVDGFSICELIEFYKNNHKEN